MKRPAEPRRPAASRDPARRPDPTARDSQKPGRKPGAKPGPKPGSAGIGGAAGGTLQQPILLLPVRIETRFVNPDKPKLRLRVYPDRVHLDRHDPRLSASEAALAQSLAPAFTARKSDDARKLTAWRSLVEQVGQHRAAFVLGRILRDDTKAEREDEETLPSLARLLPLRWHVRGFVQGTLVLDAKFKETVTRDLPASPMPEDLNQDGIAKDSEIAWMADFATAKAKGMADEFPLDPAAAGGFEELVVIGQPDPQAADLAGHIERQHVSVGAGFMPQGTATNNTEAARTGWSGRAGELDEMLHRLLPKGLATPPESTPLPGTFGKPVPPRTQVENATLFAKALGIDLPKGLAQATASDDYLQRCMNQALWPVTWGAYVNELLGYNGLSWQTPAPPDFLSAGDIAYLRDLFVGYLRGGANLPVYRVGETPYGLAVTSKGGAPREGHARRDRLIELMETLAPLWDTAAGTLPQLRDGIPRDGLGEQLAAILARVPHPRDFTLTQLFDRSWQINSYYDIKRFGLYENHVHANLVEERFGFRVTGHQARAEYTDSARHQRGAIEGLYNTLLLMEFDWRGPAWMSPNATQAEIDARTLSNGQMIPLHRPSNSDQAEINMRADGAHMDADECLELLVAVSETRILCEELMAHIDEHEARNRIFETAGAPASVFKSTIGSGHEDPDIAFALYGTELRDWPEAHLVEILDEAGEGVTAETWLGYLSTRARSYAGQGEAPDAPDWGTSGAKPLLYHLLDRALLARRSALVDAGLTVGSAMTRPKPRGVGRDRWAIRRYAQNAVRAQAELFQMIDALDELARQDPQTLRLAMRQTLDLSGWRLDAFWQAFMIQDLDAVRAATPDGSRIGGWGIVEDLKPRWRRDGPLVSESFVQAPSLTHAKTASVLRSGRQARDAGAAGDALAVDLSSARMRKAIWCFTALRDGADLGELLGGLAERGLTDAGAAELIDPLRRAVATLSEEYDPRRAPPPLDGIDLLAHWGPNGASRSTVIQAMAYADGQAPKRRRRVSTAVGAVADIADAMTDLALADATFDLVRGETSRAATTLAAIADGSAPLPDLNVLDTPDDGALITTRVMFATGTEPEAEGWPEADSLRATLDPSSEKLARQMLGPATALRFRIRAKNAHRASLADLLAACDPVPGALDLLSMAMPGEGRSALQRLFDRAAKEILKDPAAALDPADPHGALLRIEAWRKSFMDARPTLPEDFLSLGLTLTPEDPEDSPPNTEGTGHAGHVTRLSNVLKTHAARLDGLANLLPKASSETPTPVTPDAPPGPLVAALHALAPFNAWGLQDIDGTPGTEALQMRAWQVLRDGRALNTEMLATLGTARELTNEALRDAAAKLFGRGLHVPPVLPAKLAAAVTDSLKNSETRLAGVPRRPLGWLCDIGRVAPAARDLSECLMLELAETSGQPAAGVVQFPEPKGAEPWVAQAAPANRRSAGSALMFSRGADMTNELAEGFSGLVLETVIDRIPPEERVAGLALELETPNAEAPQAMLLVLPEAEKSLVHEDAFPAVRALMKWVRRRGVDGGDLPDLDQHLPAIFPSESVWDAADAQYGGAGP